MGKVIDISNNQFDDDVVLVVELDTGDIVEVEKHTWEVNHYFYNEEEKYMDSETVGSFTQYPIRLAWGVTIHKSQGKTFDKVIVDIGYGAFAHGQVYVAISRCTSMEGLILRKPIQKRHIWLDNNVSQFMKKV